MAKDKISDYSSTANSNTDIAGINIDEGCAPSGINDAIRTLMAQLKTWQSGGQDVYIHPAGSASAPSITANGDTNTGIFFPAADTVGITTGGTERARVDSSGNLGLGVTPSAWAVSAKALQIGGFVALTNFTDYLELSSNSIYDGSYKYLNTGRAASSYAQTAGTHRWFNAPSGTAGNAITFTQAMTLDASGNLGIAQTSPSFTNFGSGANGIAIAHQTTYGVLKVSGSGSAEMYFGSGSSNNYIWGYSNSPLIIAADNLERARIDSSGNLLVGTTSAIVSGRETISYNGATYNGITLSESANTANTAFAVFANASTTIGSVARNGSAASVLYNTTSDARLKSNIQDALPVLATIMQVQVRQYDWTEGELHQDYGFIAQELEPLLSGIVTKGRAEEDMWQVDYSRLTPHLVKAIQELKAEVDSLKAQIAGA